VSTLVKICGLSTLQTLEAVIEAGAEFAGFVFYPRSPRNVTIELAAALATAARGKIETVALTVDADDAALSAIAEAVRPDYLQLHGHETVERVADIAALTGIPVIKAIRVKSEEDIAATRAFDHVADRILFDAFVEQTGASLPGGNGVSFDWTWLAKAEVRRNFMLSGGLTPENVAQAIRASGASAVDVSSGVESAPGVKDPARIRAFVSAAKSAILAT
jgi:phosphoribosylanthranilate isomerase